ncbi:MAG TPA: glycosyl hydrolase [Lachnospiraceae bacterium]|nr:glycosyl hydrolase [Lachnospiraceae bacterium]
MQNAVLKEKADRLLKELTLEEKIRMIHGDGLFRSGDVKRLGIPALKMSDGPMGVRQEFHNESWIPVGRSDDYVTYLPGNSAVAATWNPALAGETGRVLGEEARGRGKDVILAPGINIKRVPVCGRNFEYMSEDPCLTARLAVAMIRGIQESDVAACVKHFALNSQETERLWVNVEADERTLREIYLPAFEAAVKEGQSHTLMGAYNLFRGEHCCENQGLLDGILRGEWGYEGAVVTDWGALHNTEAAARASVDLEMSVTDNFDEYYLAGPLLRAVRDGRVPERLVDEKAAHILLLMLRLKMIDVAEASGNAVRAVPRADRKAGCCNTPEHRQAALETARESIVLLKNEDGRLPLKAEKIKRLLVIGDNADRLHALGGGSAEIKALYEISPLMGIKNLLGGNCRVDFARGYYVESGTKEDGVNWQAASLEDKTEESNVNWQTADPEDRIEGKISETAEESPSRNGGENPREAVDADIRQKQRQLLEEAVALAKKADEVILVGGLNHDQDVEGLDRDSLALPYGQDELIEAVLAVRPDAVVVMRAGSPVSMERWSGRAKAILWDWYAGMEGGKALAEVIFGRVNPSGKLPESLPYSLEDSPALALGEYPGRKLTGEEAARMNARLTETYGEGRLVGYRYYEKYRVPVQYCFGHGLSYTSFAYSRLRIEKTDREDMPYLLALEVENTGSRAGKETVQVYVGREDSGPDEPVKALAAFRKLSLEPGEKQSVSVALPARAFQTWHTDAGAFVTDEGRYRVFVGSSLEDIRLRGEIIREAGHA